jgi:hypothetical protein
VVLTLVTGGRGLEGNERMANIDHNPLSWRVENTLAIGLVTALMAVAGLDWRQRTKSAQEGSAGVERTVPRTSNLDIDSQPRDFPRIALALPSGSGNNARNIEEALGQLGLTVAARFDPDAPGPRDQEILSDCDALLLVSRDDQARIRALETRLPLRQFVENGGVVLATTSWCVPFFHVMREFADALGVGLVPNPVVGYGITGMVPTGKPFTVSTKDVVYTVSAEKTGLEATWRFRGELVPERRWEEMNERIVCCVTKNRHAVVMAWMDLGKGRVIYCGISDFRDNPGAEELLERLLRLQSIARARSARQDDSHTAGHQGEPAEPGPGDPNAPHQYQRPSVPSSRPNPH